MSFLFPRPPQAASGSNPWFYAGLESSYPNVDGTARVGEQHACHGSYTPGCRIFHVPRGGSSSEKATEVAIDEWKDAEAGDSKDQVMVFRYQGEFRAIDHVCFWSSVSSFCLIILF